MTYPEADKIKALVEQAHHILLIQADNPDADSLGSALALEQILGDLGKEPYLYCGVDVPTYLRYLPGWDRVEKDLPKQFDLSIIVDASTYTLFDAFSDPLTLNRIKQKPLIVLDHHTNVEKPLELAQVTIRDNQVASAGEVIYHVSKQLDWPRNPQACTVIMASILGDTQGLTNDLAKPSTYRVVAELVEQGANRPALEESRRQASKMPQSIYTYKGALLARTEFLLDGRLALLTIPQAEINVYSPLYNPAPLVQFDMQQVDGVRLSIVCKTYDSGKVTGALRANYGYPVAGQLAEHMGGGGHPYASGFKTEDGRPFNEIKSECLRYALELLNNLDKEQSDETLQHADPSD